MDAREQRRRRALSKPIKLLARNGLVFTVCGTTRETYTVTFDNRASCICRDGRRVYGDIDHQCKHVLFILYKALDLNGSHIPTQTHFSPDDLQVITSSHVRGARGDVIKSVSPRMVDDQECPICLNTLDASSLSCTANFNVASASTRRAMNNIRLSPTPKSAYCVERRGSPVCIY